MAASVSLRYRDDSVRRWLRGIPGAVDKATARGLNKGVAQARTQAKNEIKARRNLPLRDVIDKDISTQKASRRKLSARVIVSGRPRSLRRYGAKVQGTRGRRTVRNAPVRVAVVPARVRTVRGGFIRRRDGAVFRRLGKERFPVKFLFGPSTTSAFEKPAVQRHMHRWAERKVPDLIEHELRMELKRV